MSAQMVGWTLYLIGVVCSGAVFVELLHRQTDGRIRIVAISLAVAAIIASVMVVIYDNTQAMLFGMILAISAIVGSLLGRVADRIDSPSDSH